MEPGLLNDAKMREDVKILNWGRRTLRFRVLLCYYFNDEVKYKIEGEEHWDSVYFYAASMSWTIFGWLIYVAYKITYVVFFHINWLINAKSHIYAQLKFRSTRAEFLRHYHRVLSGSVKHVGITTSREMISIACMRKKPIISGDTAGLHWQPVSSLWVYPTFVSLSEAKEPPNIGIHAQKSYY